MEMEEMSAYEAKKKIKWNARVNKQNKKRKINRYLHHQAEKLYGFPIFYHSASTTEDVYQ